MPKHNIWRNYVLKDRMSKMIDKIISVQSNVKSRKVEVQWNNIQKCVLGTVSDLVGKVELKAGKTLILQKIITKMEERR